MGEFSDYALDEAMDMKFPYSVYKDGDMSSEEAYELGFIDERGGEVDIHRRTNFNKHPFGRATK